MVGTGGAGGIVVILAIYPNSRAVTVRGWNTTTSWFRRTTCSNHVLDLCFPLPPDLSTTAPPYFTRRHFFSLYLYPLLLSPIFTRSRVTVQASRLVSRIYHNNKNTLVLSTIFIPYIRESKNQLLSRIKNFSNSEFEYYVHPTVRINLFWLLAQ